MVSARPSPVTVPSPSHTHALPLALTARRRPSALSVPVPSRQQLRLSAVLTRTATDPRELLQPQDQTNSERAGGGLLRNDMLISLLLQTRQHWFRFVC